MADKSAFIFEDVCLKSYEAFKAYTGRLNHASQLFVEARDSGKEWRACASAESDHAHSLYKVPSIVAMYAGKPELITMVDESTKVLQTHEYAIISARLFARLLEHSLLTGSDPVDSIHWGLSESTLPRDEKSILEMVTSPEKVQQWCVFASKLNKVPSNPASPYLNMLVRGNLLRLVLSEGSVEAAIAHSSLSEDHRSVIQSALSHEADAVDVNNINTVVSAFGLSCVLPGEVTAHVKLLPLTSDPQEISLDRFTLLCTARAWTRRSTRIFWLRETTVLAPLSSELCSEQPNLLSKLDSLYISWTKWNQSSWKTFRS